MSNNIAKITASRARRRAEVDREPGVLKAINADSDVVNWKFCCTCKEDDCARCMAFFRICEGRGVGKLDIFAYTKTLTDGAARDIIEKYWKSIFTTYQNLQSTITQHGDTVLDQWTKADRALRTDLLRKVKPKIHQGRFPQVHLCFAPGDWVKKRDHRDTWLLPYINLDNLAKTPWSVLHLLERTTSEHPSAWCNNAFEQYGVQIGLIGQHYNAGMVSIAADSFGTYNSTTDCQMLHDRRAIGFPYAEIMLESADLLLKFLDRLCTQITALPSAELNTGDNQWKTKAARSFDTEIEDQPFLCQHWSDDYTFDMAKVKRIAQGCIQSANEELLALQTEPEHLQSKAGKLVNRQYITRVKDIDRWAYLTWEVFKPAVRRYRMWEALLTRIEEYETALKLNEAVAKEMLRQVDFITAPILKELGTLIGETLPKVLVFEKYFKYSPLTISRKNLTELCNLDEINAYLTAKNFKDDPLFYALDMAGNILLHPYAQDSREWLPAFLSECLKDSSIIEKFELGELVEDFNALVKIQKILEGAPGGIEDVDDENHADSLYKDLRRRHPDVTQEIPTSFLLAMPYTAHKQQALKLESTETPVPTKEWRPIGMKLRDLCALHPWPSLGEAKTNEVKYLADCRRSNLALFKFWDAVRRGRCHELKKLNPVESSQVDAHMQRIQRDQEIRLISKGFTKRYTDLVMQENDKLSEQVQTLKRKRSEAQIGSSSTIAPTGPTAAPKKIKTNAAKQAELDAADAVWLKPKKNEDFVAFLNAVNNDFLEPEPSPVPSLDLDPEDEHPTAFITGLTKNQHDIFKRLWPHDSGYTSGAVRWDGFQAAMEAAGCTVTKPGRGGSAYGFDKEDVLGKCSITIHRTHGKGRARATVPNGILAVWGKRITKWLRWRYDSFEEPE